MKVAAVILAAGASTRLGRPKQTVVLDQTTGETLLHRAVRTATEAGLSPIVVVIRPGAAFAADLRSCVLALNPHADEGMASSIRCGLLALTGVKGAVVMTCDQVLLRPQHVQALCAQLDQITASRYAGRVGVPAYFPATAFAQLLNLKGDVGARDMLRNAATILDETLAFDIDTEDDLNQMRERLP